MWRWVSLFATLSFGVSIWLMAELGLLSSTPVVAAEKASDELSALQKTLLDKQKKYQEREEELDKRQRTLEERERVLNEQLARYETALRELKNKTTELSSLRDSRIDGFRQVYEKMEPKKAAKILDEIDMELASGILSGMRSDRAAEILGRMSSNRARTITERYLGKRGLASSQVNSNTNAEAGGPASDSKGGE